MTMLRLSAALLLLAILLCGCETVPPIPEMTRPESSGLGVEVKIGWQALPPDKIYFARIDNEDGLLQQQVFTSNHSKEGRAYLLNARPGTYVAVAAYFVSGYVQTTWYFSQRLVELTKVTVQESGFAFMGSYDLSESMGLGGADNVQTHYKGVIAPDAPTDLLSMTISSNVQRRASLDGYKNDETSRTDFFLRAKEDLAGTKWAGHFK